MYQFSLDSAVVTDNPRVSMVYNISSLFLIIYVYYGSVVSFSFWDLIKRSNSYLRYYFFFPFFFLQSSLEVVYSLIFCFRERWGKGRETLMCLVASCLHPGSGIQPAIKLHALDFESKPPPLSLRASPLILEQPARLGHTTLKLTFYQSMQVTQPSLLARF